MAYLLALVAFTLSTPTFTMADSTNIEKPEPKAWAVVIGINEYNSGKVTPLKYAVSDATAMKNVLEEQGFLVNLFQNEKATRRAIERELGTELPKRVGEMDKVLIYFSGHGQTKSLPKGGKMGYLLPADTDPTDLHGTAISMRSIQEIGELLKAKHVLFLIDACYGGVAGIRRSLQPEGEIRLGQFTKEPGRWLITAGTKEQEALEVSEWGNGLFTHFVLKGIGKDSLGDQNKDGIIPVRELHSYLLDRVSVEGELRGNHQTPELFQLTGDQGQLVFINSNVDAGPIPIPSLDEIIRPPVEVLNNPAEPEPVEKICRLEKGALIPSYKALLGKNIKLFKAGKALKVEAIFDNRSFRLQSEISDLDGETLENNGEKEFTYNGCKYIFKVNKSGVALGMFPRVEFMVKEFNKPVILVDANPDECQVEKGALAPSYKALLGRKIKLFKAGKALKVEAIFDNRSFRLQSEISDLDGEILENNGEKEFAYNGCKYIFKVNKSGVALGMFPRVEFMVKELSN